MRKVWRAPEGGRRTVGAYAGDYLVRTDLRESTRALYAGLWRHHLAPVWEHVSVADVTTQLVRAWYDTAVNTTGPTALAQSYRLLRSVLQVAVTDEVIAVNPCRLRSADNPKPARPTRARTAAFELDAALATTRRASGAHLGAEVLATAGLVLVIFSLTRSDRAGLAAPAVGAYIGSAYWFTSSTSFANPAVTVGRTFSDTFAGIALSSVAPFIVAQLIGGVVGTVVVLFLYPRDRHPQGMTRLAQPPGD